jgi:MFS family permease
MGSTLTETTQKATPYCWIMWSMAAAFIFYKYVVEVSPSVMTDELMQAYSIHGARLGNLAASYFYAYLLMQLPVGILLDRYGVRFITFFAIIFCAAGTLLLGHTDNIFYAEIGRFISGFGAAFAAVSMLKLTATWFSTRQFALLAGLMMSVGMTGAVFGQAPLAEMISSLGWRLSLTVIGFIGLLLAVAYLFIVRDKPKLKNHEPYPFLKGLGLLLKNNQTWWLSIYSGLAFTPISVLGGVWGVPFLITSFHFTRTAAATDISLVFIGFAIGAPLFGFISDRLGKRKPVILAGTFISTILAIFIVYIHLSLWALALGFFAFGFFLSTFMLSFAMIRENNPLFIAATALAFMNLFNALLCALSEPLVGLILDILWGGKKSHNIPVFTATNYEIALTLIPVYLILAMVCLFKIKETRCEQFVLE